MASKSNLHVVMLDSKTLFRLKRKAENKPIDYLILISTHYYIKATNTPFWSSYQKNIREFLTEVAVS